MSSNHTATDQQTTFSKQATILRRNLGVWDGMLHNPRGEDWPKMLGRANAAMNQSQNLDRSIQDVMDHFVYVPKQATANPQDIPFFLSTKLDATTTTTTTSNMNGSSGISQTKKKNNKDAPAVDFTTNVQGDPVQVLSKYEINAATAAKEYEEEMIRF